MNGVNEWLKERRRIHAKGSTGYWASDEKDWDEPYDTTLVYDVFHNGDTMDRDLVADASYDNAEVIVDAHNTLPALLDAMERVLLVLDAGVRDGDSAELIRRVALMEIEEAIEGEA